VNEAVELAKEFSTDKSPAFVNALLDKVLKRVLKEQSAVEEDVAAPDVQIPGQVSPPAGEPRGE
jgi:hypothetical protein